MLIELQQRLMDKLKKQTLPARILLNRFYFPDEDLRKKPEYTDSGWMPFWYYLGEDHKPKKILDVGSRLGLEAACCVVGSKPPVVASVDSVQSRFTYSNLKTSGARIDDAKDCDLGIVNGKFFDRLDFIWERTKLDGLICAIGNREAFEVFAKIKNRVPVFCKLRYTVGLLRK